MLSVLLYTGEGADVEARDDLKSLLVGYFKERGRAIDLVETADGGEFHDAAALRRYGLIAFPGGFDLGFVRCLRESGMTNLGDRVRSGSCGFVGMCAGAYFACREIEFAKGDPELEVVGSRLGLYRGCAIGPVFPGFDYKSLAGARAVETALRGPLLGNNNEDDKVHAYFNGGPKFVNDDAADSTVQQLAVYTEEEAAGQSAVVLVKCGSGGALLFGPHPEMDKKQLEQSQDGRLLEIFAKLTRGADKRRLATYRMLDELMKIVDGH